MKRMLVVVDDFDQNVELTEVCLRQDLPSVVLDRLTIHGFTCPYQASVFMAEQGEDCEVFLVTDGNLKADLDGPGLVKDLYRLLGDRLRKAVIATHGYTSACAPVDCISVRTLNGKLYQQENFLQVRPDLIAFALALPIVAA
ncbi:hypothetical protein GF380_02685 [Candidatus Uhrbacteria bacterium]|nr:hypothetical protein [Candidatus Uhrbacteria bacterium]MBD3284069.1 hypothetical protein [Candidatus Uhrbacteria bacterium]